MTTTTPPARRTVTWRGLVPLAVAGDLALLFAQVAARHDREALAVALTMLLSAGLLRLRRGLAGRLLLCLSFANLLAWMLPAAASDAGHGDSLIKILLPAALAAFSLVGLVASVATIASRNNPAAGGGAVRWSLAAVAVVAVVVVAASVAGPGPAGTARGGELALSMSDVAYKPATISAPSGQLTIYLVNHDLFWHSFTIDQPAVNIDVPVGGARRATLSIPPGTYQFYCRVPGHKQAGMVGTVTVG